jgi:iron complex transport system substrate-binding protein
LRRIRSTFLVAACALALGAVGTAGPAGAGVARAGDPPKKIVSLSPTATEMLFAVGAGKQVVAVDDQSSFPKRAPRTDLSGFEPNAEAIAGYEPDLVVMDSDAVKSQLEALGIDVLVLPAAQSLKDSYAQIRRLGKVTGHGAAANDVASEMKADVAGLAADAKDGKPPSSYYELDDTYFSADSTTFIGRLLKLAGFTNIADEAAGDGSGYPQLSAEYVVDSDPAVIFLADTKCCGQSAKTVAARPGFGDLTAVRDGNVVALDDDVASRWGPRVVELLRTMVKERQQL